MLSRVIQTALRPRARYFATSAKTASNLDLILIGSIGAVTHCSHLQWTLFNQALREVMNDESLEWDKQSYIDSLSATGGKIRLKAYLGERHPELATDENVKKVYDRKNELFVDAIKQGKEDGSLQLRPGLIEMLRAAKESNIKTGFCTTTAESVMNAFVETFEMKELLDFAFHDGHYDGHKGKPDPGCYLNAVKTILGEDAVESADGQHKHKHNVIAFEDTEISLESPARANIPCVAMPNNWVEHQDFSKSIATVSELPKLAGFDANCIQALAGLLAHKETLVIN